VHLDSFEDYTPQVLAMVTFAFLPFWNMKTDSANCIVIRVDWILSEIQ
jgi:hypothetical protein